MTTTDTVRDITHAALLGHITATDELLTLQRNTRTDHIRRRLAAATPGPWILSDRRSDRANAQIGLHFRPTASSYHQIANVMRRGPNPAGDAVLISHAPIDTGWLLNEVARLTAERNLLLAAATPAARLTYYSHRTDARQHELRRLR